MIALTATALAAALCVATLSFAEVELIAPVEEK